jgi:hypothetical protein
VNGAGARWYERFEAADGDPALGGDRSFVRLFDPDGGRFDAVLMAAERVSGDAAVYLLRRGDPPRLVHALDDLGELLASLPDTVEERRLGEWREIPADVPRGLAATARWVAWTAGL